MPGSGAPSGRSGKVGCSMSTAVIAPAGPHRLISGCIGCEWEGREMLHDLKRVGRRRLARKQRLRECDFEVRQPLGEREASHWVVDLLVLPALVRVDRIPVIEQQTAVGARRSLQKA